MKTKNTEPWMHEGEIRYMYRKAKNPKKQIRVLAELNNVSVDIIKKIIGIEPIEEVKKMKEYKPWTEEEINTLCALYGEGKTIRE